MRGFSRLLAAFIGLALHSGRQYGNFLEYYANIEGGLSLWPEWFWYVSKHFVQAWAKVSRCSLPKFFPRCHPYARKSAQGAEDPRLTSGSWYQQHVTDAAHPSCDSSPSCPLPGLPSTHSRHKGRSEPDSAYKSPPPPPLSAPPQKLLGNPLPPSRP